MRLPNGEKLTARAKELGIDITGDARTQSISGAAPRASDHELQRRVIEAERAQRESKLWMLALVSGIASVVSAVAAWVAVAK